MSDENKNREPSFAERAEKALEQTLRAENEQTSRENMNKVGRMLYDHYSALVQAGFTEAQAIYLVNEMFKAMVACACSR